MKMRINIDEFLVARLSGKAGSLLLALLASRAVISTFSNKELMERTGMHERSVQRAKDELLKAELVTRDGNKLILSPELAEFYGLVATTSTGASPDPTRQVVGYIYQGGKALPSAPLEFDLVQEEVSLEEAEQAYQGITKVFESDLDPWEDVKQMCARADALTDRSKQGQQIAALDELWRLLFGPDDFPDIRPLNVATAKEYLKLAGSASMVYEFLHDVSMKGRDIPYPFGFCKAIITRKMEEKEKEKEETEDVMDLIDWVQIGKIGAAQNASQNGKKRFKRLNT